MEEDGANGLYECTCVDVEVANMFDDVRDFS
jgi:hypothetical protein